MGIRKSRLEQQVASIRHFNRFYTSRLGLLRSRYLDSDYSLTESRILFQLALQSGLTARELRSALEMDRGYISRLLASLVRRGLIEEMSSPRDGREKLLTLSDSGAQVASALNEAADDAILRLIGQLSGNDRGVLVESLAKVEQILSCSDL